MGLITCEELLDLLHFMLGILLLLGKGTESAQPRYVKLDVFSLDILELTTNCSPSVSPDCQGFFDFRSLTHLS
jgi:hypothetical protein